MKVQWIRADFDDQMQLKQGISGCPLLLLNKSRGELELGCVCPPDLSSIRSVVYLQMGRSCLTNQRPRNGRNSTERDPKVIKAGGSPQGVCSPNVCSIQSAVCLQIRENCSTNWRQVNDVNSAERDQRLISLGEAPDEFAYHIWAQSDQRFCAETTKVWRASS